MVSFNDLIEMVRMQVSSVLKGKGEWLIIMIK